MATSVISNTRHGATGFQVTATLMPGVAFKLSDATELERVRTTTADGTGTWSLALEQQVNIVPSGSFWLIEEHIDEDDEVGHTQLPISVGASSATLYASIIEPTTSTGITNYLTQEVADARYLRSLTITLGYFNVVEDYGATGDGVTDDTAAIQAAVTAAGTAGGGIVFFPAGTYKITAKVSWNTSILAGVSVILRGTGRYASVINYVGTASNILSFESSDPSEFQRGLVIEDMGITDSGGSGAHTGIYLKGVWQVYFRNVRCEQLTGNGIWIDSPVGDPDAPLWVCLDTCTMRGNSLRGVNVTCGATTPSSNASFISIRNSQIQENLLAGVYWTGATCSIRDSGIADNGASGEGGMIVGDPGGSNFNLSMDAVSFDNNYNFHMDIQSLRVGHFTNMEFRNSSGTFTATQGVRLKPAVGRLVHNITFDGVDIHVISAFNPFTFWVVDGSAGSGAEVRGVQLRDVNWRTYDNTGQVRYSVTGAVYDFHPQHPRTEEPSAITLAVGANSNVDIGYNAEVFHSTAPAGDFSITGMAKGIHGRRLRWFIDNTGANRVCTITHRATSSAGNQITTGTGYDIITNAGTLVIEAEYDSRAISGGAWVITGVTYGTREAYTITNVTTDRAYDANATTTDELADVLGTLIADLKVGKFPR